MCLLQRSLSRKFCFSKLVIWKKKTPYQSSNLWNIIRQIDAVYFQMLTISFFQFSLNSRYQRNIFVMFAALIRFSLLLLKMSFKCSINVNQQSKDKPLICTVSRAANDHVNAFFQDRPIFYLIFFFFVDNLGYSLFKNARFPNL